MKPFIAPLALAALAWAGPASAGHPPGSPLGGSWNGVWEDIGHIKADADEPGREIYVNTDDFDPDYESQFRLYVHEWEVYDEPLEFPEGKVVEVGYEYLFDCVNRKLYPGPSFSTYGADGEIVFSQEGNGGSAEMVDIPDHGLGFEMAKRVCD